MLAPKKTKYRKTQRGRMKRKATSGNRVIFGDYGLQALEPGWITSNQIEAARIVISKNLKKGGKVWIRIFPHKSITKKPAETRMGGGKGDVDKYVAVVRPGTIMFEVTGLKEDQAMEVLKQASYKLPIKTRFVVKQGG
ncbi:MAG: 50S ribosomal protein L16 [Candidatus Calescibacterium sp.]|nr:50S ribosomal protein L16 [Candidatus Calescibacterium sp.]MCX7972707.1 50S ribosomal protein L16 [bacterium]MDW8195511.1 50S ribosomal protein L16 [Candidatus Calescibacterium sp.]